MREGDPVKVAFIYAAKDREDILADAFLEGVKKLGDEVCKISKGDFSEEHMDHDVYCMVGVKSLKLFTELRERGKDIIFFDKGYFRHRGPHRTWEYWRVAVNAHHPTEYVALAKHGATRWKALSKYYTKVKDWRPPQEGRHIILAGSSEKYHAFCGLPDPTTYAKEIIKKIKKRTNRRIIYRPKPTWYDATRVPGADFSSRGDSIMDVLPGAWCMVTHGSNAAFEAALEGIPTICLGNGIVRPISSTSLDDIENPRLADQGARFQWFCNLSWCMFTEEEMRVGLAWLATRPQLFDGQLDDSQVDESFIMPIRPSKHILKKTGVGDKSSLAANLMERKNFQKELKRKQRAERIRKRKQGKSGGPIEGVL